MAYMLIRHAVKNYAKWRPVFDEHGTVRKTSGSKGGHLLRNADNPNEVVLLLEWDDLKRARKFAESEELRKAMERAGVADKPDVHFFYEAERLPA